MAPSEKLQLFRWQFVPVENGRDGSVRWSWRAFTQTGQLAFESKDTFETLTECIDDARANGYGSR